jgi:hypothetical protein
MKVKKQIDLLGKRCEDKVTGLEGVITSISFDLYGCIQAIVHPGLDKDGKLEGTIWFDVARLTILSDKPVMEPPNFDYGIAAEGKKGPSEKPMNMKN